MSVFGPPAYCWGCERYSSGVYELACVVNIRAGDGDKGLVCAVPSKIKICRLCLSGTVAGGMEKAELKAANDARAFHRLIKGS